MASEFPISRARRRSIFTRWGRRWATCSPNVPASLCASRFTLELGRWLVGEAGVYLTRVTDRKESRGETFLVTDGGLHHMLAASGNFGQLLRRNYPVAMASRFGAAAEEVANVVGNLCTPLDLIGEPGRTAARRCRAI